MMQDRSGIKTVISWMLIAGIVVVLGGGAMMSTQIFERLSAEELMVVQAPISGKLTVCTEPGLYWQGFGTVTHYPRRSQFWFSAKADQGTKVDDSIKVRFNDGGHANISGSLSYELPTDKASVEMIQKNYGSAKILEQQLIRVTAEKSIYMTGALMSSKESAAEKRAELLYYIENQIQEGVYQTSARSEQVFDSLTSLTKTVVVAGIQKSADGQQLRVEESLVKKYKVQVSNISFIEIKYEETVEGQIKQQQEAIMQIQTAIAKSRQAEQKALTAEKEGQADAAKAKWEQEAIKAKAVVEADQQKEVAETLAEKEKSVAVTKAKQELEVAKLEMQAAEQFKLSEKLKGEGEGARKAAVMAANGALEEKLKAYTAVNAAYADAIAKHQGAWVPTIVMGAAPGSQTQNGATELVQMLTAKTARDLTADITIPKRIDPPAAAPAPAPAPAAK